MPYALLCYYSFPLYYLICLTVTPTLIALSLATSTFSRINYLPPIPPPSPVYTAPNPIKKV